MARVMRELVVCDVCGGDDNVITVKVALDGAERSSELCAAHRQQLLDAVASVVGASSATVKSGAVRRGRKVAASGTAARKRTATKSAAAKSATSARGRMPRTTCPHCGLEMGVQNFSRHIAAKHPEAA